MNNLFALPFCQILKSFNLQFLTPRNILAMNSVAYNSLSKIQITSLGQKPEVELLGCHSTLKW